MRFNAHHPLSDADHAVLDAQSALPAALRDARRAVFCKAFEAEQRLRASRAQHEEALGELRAAEALARETAEALAAFDAAHPAPAAVRAENEARLRDFLAGQTRG